MPDERVDAGEVNGNNEATSPSERDAGSAPAKGVRVDMPSGVDLDIPLATDVLVNFTGTEFLITLMRVVPPPFRTPDELPESVEAKILFRAALSPGKWIEAVTSMAAQIELLRTDGKLPDRGQDSERQ